jgi:hypothetical protein
METRTVSMDPGMTHYEGCWREREHRDCAAHQLGSIPASDIRHELLHSWDREVLLREALERVQLRPSHAADIAQKALSTWDAMYEATCWGGSRAK